MATIEQPEWNVQATHKPSPKKYIAQRSLENFCPRPKTPKTKQVTLASTSFYKQIENGISEKRLSNLFRYHSDLNNSLHANGRLFSVRINFFFKLYYWFIYLMSIERESLRSTCRHVIVSKHIQLFVERAPAYVLTYTTKTNTSRPLERR